MNCTFCDSNTSTITSIFLLSLTLLFAFLSPEKIIFGQNSPVTTCLGCLQKVPGFQEWQHIQCQLRKKEKESVFTESLLKGNVKSLEVLSHIRGWNTENWNSKLFNGLRNLAELQFIPGGTWKYNNHLKELNPYRSHQKWFLYLQESRCQLKSLFYIYF